MAAFAAAIEVGAHALETDLHLSKDGVVMLSHDATLKRCFGVDKKIIDYNYSELKPLRTIRKPPQPMPTLFDILQLLSHPDNSHVWLLLDIKTDNIAEDIIRQTAKTILSVNSDPLFWSDRIQLGVWNIDFVPLCDKYLPEFQITYIGFSTVKAQEFFQVPHAAFNIIFPAIAGPFGDRFLRQAAHEDRDVYVWTVNDKALMKWAIQLGVNGVCTDDPELFLQVCNETRKSLTRERRTFRAHFFVWSRSIFLPLFAFLVRKRYRLRLRKK